MAEDIDAVLRDAGTKKDEPTSSTSKGKRGRKKGIIPWNKGLKKDKSNPPAPKEKKPEPKPDVKPKGKDLGSENDKIKEELAAAGDEVVLENGGGEGAHEPEKKPEGKKSIGFTVDKKVLYYAGGAVAAGVLIYALFGIAKKVVAPTMKKPADPPAPTPDPKPEVRTGPRMVQFNIAAEGQPPRYIEVPAEKVGQ